MKRHGPWRTLGLDPTGERAAIRRAYADKLRALDPDRDIGGFAKLRAARDHALALARSMATADADTPGPALSDDNQPILPADDEDLFADDANLFADDDFLDEARYGRSDFVRYDTSPAPPASPGEPAAPAPPEVLLALLYPGGAVSEEPLTAEEWAVVHPALTAILGEAAQSPIDRQAQIEDWLSHHLASAWPRSAWLVEEAATAFGWRDESGRLGERPAVLFLNQRLRGMRFQTLVAEPRHPLHRAWVELSKPGSRPSYAFMRVSRDDVQRLLSGIRERYPEVESHLDPARVASWEAGGNEDSPTFGWLKAFRVFPVIATLALIRLCSGALDPSPPPQPPVAALMPWKTEQVDALVVELFGERLEDDILKGRSPSLWPQIQRSRQYGGGSDVVFRAVSVNLVTQLRRQTLVAAKDAPFEELVAIKQLKLELLQTARSQAGPFACMALVRENVMAPGLSIPEDLRARERNLARHLAVAGLLVPSNRALPTRTPVPGSVVEELLRATGLSQEALDKAASGEDSDALQCNYRIALLETVLRQPGKVSTELLRIL